MCSAEPNSYSLNALCFHAYVFTPEMPPFDSCLPNILIMTLNILGRKKMVPSLSKTAQAASKHFVTALTMFLHILTSLICPPCFTSF
jgi:hypothetical protein